MNFTTTSFIVLYFIYEQVVAGWGHSAALTRGGALYTCGRNFQGQLGLGDPSTFTLNERGHPHQPEFKHVKALSHVQVSKVSCGGEHSVALTKSGEVYTFGKGMNIFNFSLSQRLLLFP